MNRTIKEATAQRYHLDNQNQLLTLLNDFIATHNFVEWRTLQTVQASGSF